MRRSLSAADLKALIVISEAVTVAIAASFLLVALFFGGIFAISATAHHFGTSVIVVLNVLFGILVSVPILFAVSMRLKIRPLIFVVGWVGAFAAFVASLTLGLF